MSVSRAGDQKVEACMHLLQVRPKDGQSGIEAYASEDSGHGECRR